jgi:hypothetical protein
MVRINLFDVPYLIFSSLTLRPTRDPTTRVYIRPRNECPRCPIPVYHAIRAGSVLLFRQVHRRVLSTLCTTNIRRCSPRLEGSFSLFSLLRVLTWFQLLDRCLKIVDPELFTHLRSKNLSAEIYAFPCPSLLFDSPKRADIDVNSCPHTLRMHTPS